MKTLDQLLAEAVALGFDAIVRVRARPGRMMRCTGEVKYDGTVTDKRHGTIYVSSWNNGSWQEYPVFCFEAHADSLEDALAKALDKARQHYEQRPKTSEIAA